MNHVPVHIQQARVEPGCRVRFPGDATRDEPGLVFAGLAGVETVSARNLACLIVLAHEQGGDLSPVRIGKA